MALDLIKEFLVGIGFDVDAASLKNAEQSMDKAEQTVKKFNNNSNKGFSESSNSLKNLFTLLGTTGGSIGKLFPELQIPFKNLIKDINTVKGLYKELSTNNNNPENPKEKPTPEGKNNIDTSKQEVTTEIKNMMPPIKKLETEGKKSIKIFENGAVSSFAAVAASIAALLVVGTGLTKFLTDLAKQDIEYDKLARQLWTTKENAREIDMALKTMGVTMKDLWLSPDLLNQFNQLRKDSAALKLPPEYQKNLQLVKSLVFEFQRLKQLGSLAFQWIGNYIMKYAAGPIATIQQALHKFNDEIITKIPGAAKVIGGALGIILRLFLDIIEALGYAFDIAGKLFSFIGGLLDKMPGPVKTLIKLLMLVGAVILAGPIAAVAGLLLALDDLFTFLRGGHSVIGSFFNYLKEKGESTLDYLEGKYKKIKDSMKSGLAAIKDNWHDFWKSVQEYMDKALDKFKTLEEKFKSSEFGKKFLNTVSDVKSKVQGFEGAVKNDMSSITSYIMPQTTNNKTSNSNQTNNNNTTNNFTIYSSDATSTANAVSSKINNGKNIRNLQGVTW